MENSFKKVSSYRHQKFQFKLNVAQQCNFCAISLCNFNTFFTLQTFILIILMPHLQVARVTDIYFQMDADEVLLVLAALLTGMKNSPTK